MARDQLEKHKHKLIALVELQPVFNSHGNLVRFNHIFRDLVLPQKEKHSDIIGLEHAGEVPEHE